MIRVRKPSSDFTVSKVTVSGGPEIQVQIALGLSLEMFLKTLSFEAAKCPTMRSYDPQFKSHLKLG